MNCLIVGQSGSLHLVDCRVIVGVYEADTGNEILVSRDVEYPPNPVPEHQGLAQPARSEALAPGGDQKILYSVTDTDIIRLLRTRSHFPQDLQ